MHPRAERWCDCEGHCRWKRAGSTLFCNGFGNWLPATALKTPISVSSVFRLFFILFFWSNFIVGAISSIGLLFFFWVGMQPWYISTYIYVSGTRYIKADLHRWTHTSPTLPDAAYDTRNQGRVVSHSELSLLSACVRLCQLREVHHSLQQALNPWSRTQSAATDGSPACFT